MVCINRKSVPTASGSPATKAGESTTSSASWRVSSASLRNACSRAVRSIAISGLPAAASQEPHERRAVVGVEDQPPPALAADVLGDDGDAQVRQEPAGGFHVV